MSAAPDTCFNRKESWHAVREPALVLRQNGAALKNLDFCVVRNPDDFCRSRIAGLIPAVCRTLTALTNLDLSNNRISQIPPGMIIVTLKIYKKKRA